MEPANENARRQPGVENQNKLCKFSPQSAETVKPSELRSPRERRLLTALLEGPLSRESLDRRIGASNTPDVVFRLRKKGFEIPCERREGIDRDGLTCRFGVYSMAETDRPLALAFLSPEARHDGAGL